MTSYADRDAFYGAYPQHAWSTYPGSAPAGVDVHFGKAYLVILCCSEEATCRLYVDQVVGTLVAFEHASGAVHVLDPNTSVAEADVWLRTPAGARWTV